NHRVFGWSAVPPSSPLRIGCELQLVRRAFNACRAPHGMQAMLLTNVFRAVHRSWRQFWQAGARWGGAGREIRRPLAFTASVHEIESDASSREAPTPAKEKRMDSRTLSDNRLAYRGLRGWLDEVQAMGELLHVNGADWDVEMGAITHMLTEKSGGTAPAILF